MTEAAYVGAYWGSRSEPVGSCASRLRECLRSLAGLSPTLSQWKAKGRSEAEAVANPHVEESRLVELLEGGVNRRDTDGSVIAELGYSWSAWNGVSMAAAALALTCGATAAEHGILNSFVLDLPDPSDEGVELYRPETMTATLAAVARAWSPDFATVTSHGLRETIGYKPAHPVVGWMTYLGPGRPVPARLVGADVVPMGEGTTVIAARDWESISSPQVRAIADQLDRAGALRAVV